MRLFVRLFILIEGVDVLCGLGKYEKNEQKISAKRGKIEKQT